MTKKLLFLAATVLLMAGCSKVKVSDLRTEQLAEPLNLSTTTPRFSWLIESNKNDVMQTAYHILVASSPDLLDEGKADLWDSKRVESDASIWVPYGGAPLTSNQQVFWKVKVYTTQGSSRWSQPAHFAIGLLHADEWKAQWIGHEQLFENERMDTLYTRIAARHLRNEFSTLDGKKVQRAIVHVCGLGLFEMYINGQRVGDDVMTPGPTDYRKRLFYNTYDVSSLLSDHANAIGVILGSGRYVTMRPEDVLNQEDMFGMPKLILQMHITYADGTEQLVCSDTTWRLSANGPIRANNEYDGEEYDARMTLGDWSTAGYDDSQWLRAEQAIPPAGILTGHPNDNIRIRQTINAKTITNVGNNRHIIDFGQNLSGRAVVNIHDAASGDTITFRFAEILKDNDSNLYTDNLRSALQTDRYISNGNSDRWHPTFVIHGFRYMEVSGMNNLSLDDFSAQLIFDDIETTASFETSNDIINKIYANAWWGIADNYRGWPMDCCQRDERMPWLGDRTAGCYGESYIFGNHKLYAKWMTDICHSQEDSGNIPNVCPTYWRIMSPNMTWPAALPMGCDMLYQQYGNLEPMRQCYDNIHRWMDFMMQSFMDADSIITKDTWGDWCMPPEREELIHSKDPSRITSGALMSTAYYVKISQMMAHYAPLVGHKTDTTLWLHYAADLTRAFNKRFLHLSRRDDGTIDSAYYDNNTATANVLPLAFGMVPDEYRAAVEQTLINKIVADNNSHISCGVVGMSWVQRLLTSLGHGDLAFRLASNTSWPSYGYMIEHGATTIWELWNGNTAAPQMNSGNHVMLLGDLITWFFRDLAGIQPAAPGYKHIRLAPDFSISDLTSVNASYKSLYGEIHSQYTKSNDGKTSWQVTIPCNTTATICLPDGDKVVGSGKYSFTF
ncbi:MAG: glycoside hydrolase family 78 protein [Bacteroidales bacterium]|nr:glycoside hydrolase family 78 protein [Bacteroidales bacterium]